MMRKDVHKQSCAKNNTKSEIILSGTLAAVTVVTGAFLMSTTASADDSVVSDVSVTVSESCTFKGIISTPHTASVDSGILTPDIGSTTLKAFCNDNGGFAIYAIGYTDEEYGKTVLSSQNLGDTKDIATGTNASGTSSWAMKLDNSLSTTYPIELDNGFGAYSAVPSSYTQVAHRNGGTDLGTEATGAILTSTYQVYISSDQPADNYQGKVKYTMVHPGDSAPQVLYMQNISEWKDRLENGQEVYAIDHRDNKGYTVAKLADGNIWMTQNLDFDIIAGKTYSSDDTDLPVGSTWTPTTSTVSTHDIGGALWESSFFVPESYDPGNIYWNGDLNSEYSDSAAYLSGSGNGHYHLGNYYNWTAAVAMNDSSTYNSTYGVQNVVNQSICPAGWTLPKAGTSEKSFYKLLNSYNYQTVIKNEGFSGKSINGDNSLWSKPLFFSLSGDTYTQGNSVMLENIGSEGIFWTSVSTGPMAQTGANSNIYQAYALDFYATDYLSDFKNSTKFGTSVRCVSR